MSGRRVFAIIGFVLAGIFFVGAILIAMLFLVPGFSLFGITSVERETAITYDARTNPDIDFILRSRNILVISNQIDVEIRVRKEGQLDEGSIQVWERANGLTFNQITHTHVTWDTFLIDGIPFSRIMIHEPSGMLSRNGHVFINLFSDANVSGEYNFILDTGRSNVAFTSDDVEDEVLQIASVNVRHASGQINFPNPTQPQHFRVEVTDLDIRGNGVRLTNFSTIMGNVRVFGNNVVTNLGDVEGNITIGTEQNRVTSTMTVGFANDVVMFGHMHFSQSSGADIIRYGVFLNGSGTINIEGAYKLEVVGIRVTANVRNIVYQIDFVATEYGNITVQQVSDEDWLYHDDFVNITIPHGQIALHNVFCDVDINTWVGSATTAVHFSLLTRDLPKLKVRAFDGRVYATNIQGVTDIEVSYMGRAYVVADFIEIVGNSRIQYNGPTRPNNAPNAGRITVGLAQCIPNARIHVYHTAGARNFTDILYNALTGQPVENGAVLANMGQFLVHGVPGVLANLTLTTSNNIRVEQRPAI